MPSAIVAAGSHWPKWQKDILIAADHLGWTNAKIANYLERPVCSINEELRRMRHRGVALTRHCDMTNEQLSVAALYRRKKIPAREAWAEVWKP